MIAEQLNGRSRKAILLYSPLGEILLDYIALWLREFDDYSTTV